MERLSVGTILKDASNEYIVRDSDSRNSHSQYPSDYLIECYAGPNIPVREQISSFWDILAICSCSGT